VKELGFASLVCQSLKKENRLVIEDKAYITRRCVLYPFLNHSKWVKNEKDICPSKVWVGFGKMRKKKISYTWNAMRVYFAT
jgi:hypothetical protein